MSQSSLGLTEAAIALANALSRKSPRILVVGDVMLDQYISGNIERISPEAPVPVLECTSEFCRPGGAANVVSNLLSLGATATLTGITGDDETACLLGGQLEKTSQFTNRLVKLSSRVTTRKVRMLSNGQQLLRIDFEETAPLEDATVIEMLRPLLQPDSGFDAIVVSDYGKGVCTDKAMQMLIAFGKQQHIPVLCDPKGDSFDKYKGAYLITPNRKEAARATRQPCDDRFQAQGMANRIREDYGLSACIVTLGPDGLVLADDHGARHFATLGREVADVTGAGDTVIATMAVGLGAQLPLHQAALLANAAAGLAVRKVGSAAITLREVQDFCQDVQHIDLVSRKILSVADMADTSKRLRLAGDKMVFTNGCFDLLHAGHVDLLSKAADLGQVLIVGVNSDRSVSSLKGDGRPVIGESDRAQMIAALSCVDYVVIFDEETPLSLIESIKPDILVKGGDYSRAEIVGGDYVESLGGRVETIELKPGLSTTGTINKIVAGIL